MAVSATDIPAALEPLRAAVEAAAVESGITTSTSAPSTSASLDASGSEGGTAATGARTPDLIPTNGEPDSSMSTGASPSIASLRLAGSVDTPDTSSDFGDDERERAATPEIHSAAAMRAKYHRHISRSAAKRDSVAQLPSIRDLRIHFGGGAKAEHRAGLGVGIRALGATYEDNDEHRSSGESPRPVRKPYKDVQLVRVGPEQARSEARQLVGIVRTSWGVVRTRTKSSLAVLSAPARPPSPTAPPDDVRSLLVETARAVRRVRILALSLVHTGQRRVSAPLKGGIFNTPSRPAVPRVVSGGTLLSASNVPTQATQPPDPTAAVRRAALDLLGHLRTLEERMRLQHNAPTVVIIPEAAEPTFATSLIEEFPPDLPLNAPQSRRLSTGSLRPSQTSSVDDIFSDDDDWNVNMAAAREADLEGERSRQAWEERLVLEERAYKPLEARHWSDESAAVRAAVGRWTEAVERAFGERYSDDVPNEWAETPEGPFRIYDFFAAHLSPEHAALLPLPTDYSALLNRLSDGYLLVETYNQSVHSSARPWGFIGDEEMFDTLSSATESGKEWTFRRVQNLTTWAAALRLRYSLPITLPHAMVLAPPTLPDGKPAPLPPRMPSTGGGGRRKDLPPIDFDPLAVARHSAGWEAMLRALVEVWVEDAAREVRGENRRSSLSLEVFPAAPPSADVAPAGPQ